MSLLFVIALLFAIAHTELYGTATCRYVCETRSWPRKARTLVGPLRYYWLAVLRNDTLEKPSSCYFLIIICLFLNNSVVVFGSVVNPEIGGWQRRMPNNLGRHVCMYL